MGWPSHRDEQWRYANLRAFERLRGYRRRRPRPRNPRRRSPRCAPTLSCAMVPGFERLIYLDGVLIEGESRFQEATTTDSLQAAVVPEQRLGLLCDMFASDAARLRVQASSH